MRLLGGLDLPAKVEHYYAVVYLPREPTPDEIQRLLDMPYLVIKTSTLAICPDVTSTYHIEAPIGPFFKTRKSPYGTTRYLQREESFSPKSYVLSDLSPPSIPLLLINDDLLRPVFGVEALADNSPMTG